MIPLTTAKHIYRHLIKEEVFTGQANQKLCWFLRQNKVVLRTSLKNSHDYWIENQRLKKTEKTLTDLKVLIQRISVYPIPFKSYAHLPDHGDDIDLHCDRDQFLMIRSALTESKNIFLEQKVNILDRLTGRRRQYVSLRTGVQIEFHIGRLGIIGEFEGPQADTDIAQPLLQKFPDLSISDIRLLGLLCHFWVIQRIYTKCFIRLSDILFYRTYVRPAYVGGSKGDPPISVPEDIKEGFIELCRILELLDKHLKGDAKTPTPMMGLKFNGVIFQLTIQKVIELQFMRLIINLKNGKILDAFLQTFSIPLLVLKVMRLRIASTRSPRD